MWRFMIFNKYIFISLKLTSHLLLHRLSLSSFRPPLSLVLVIVNFITKQSEIFVRFAATCFVPCHLVLHVAWPVALFMPRASI